MKTLLVVAAALGLSVVAASADCPGHTKQVLASTVDYQMKTASVEATQPMTSTPEQPVIVDNDEEAKAD